ncbi:MAG: sigma-70 family RNA polymerase sigma factor, partial [Clostridia bacterium]|nr:sigma-70 family RNA polymerase sigma factor [Clostridia bacterium]
EQLALKLSREPKIEEIAAELGVAKEEVSVALDAIVDPVSLYEPIYSENGDSVYVMDKICDTSNTDESWLEKIAISQAMEKLTPREKRIIMMRFFQGRTQMEVAKEISISQAQVSRLEKGALDRIKRDLK